jgi:hypothetical protein
VQETPESLEEHIKTSLLSDLNGICIQVVNIVLQGVFMKKSLLLVGMLLLASSQAQDGAAQIFERAKAAHGGAALENIITYRDSGSISYFDEKGQVTVKLEYKQLYNFSNNTVRFEYFQDKKVVQILQTTPSLAWGWTQQSGVVRLPPAQAKLVRDSGYQKCRPQRPQGIWDGQTW